MSKITPDAKYYCDALKMYADMLNDLADLPEYTERLKSGVGLSEIEIALCKHIVAGFQEK